MKRRGLVYGVAALALLTALVGGIGFYLKDKIHLRPDHAVVEAGDFDRKLQPADLRADFAALVRTAAHIHPDFRRIVDSAEFEDRRSRIVAALDRPMNRIEFWRVASALNGTLHDGHSGLPLPVEEWQHASETLAVVPLQVELDDAGIAIVGSLDPAIPTARLFAINGIPAAALRDWITDRISGETLAYRRSAGAAAFARWVWLRGIQPPYRIEWAPADGPSQTAVARGVPLASWASATGSPGATPLQLTIDGDVARLVVASFEQPDADYAAFLEESFRRIRDRHVQALIVDVRRNQGGSSSQADLLQSYLSDRLLPSIREVRVRTTPEVKARYRTLLPPGFRWIPINSLFAELRGIQTAPDNGFFASSPEGTEPSARSSANPLQFHGDLYLLISPVTYSAAAIFAAPLRYWGRAILIGQPTGEPLVFYGDNYEFDLPATRLQATVSHKQFSLFGATDPALGVQPQIAIGSREDALARALREIARRRAARAPA